MSGYLNKYNLQGWLSKDVRTLGEEGKQRFVLNILESKVCKKRKNETEDQHEERKRNMTPKYLTIYCPFFMEWVRDFKKDDFILASVRISEEKIRVDDKDGSMMISKVCNLDEVINITQGEKYRKEYKSKPRGDVPKEVAVPEDVPF